MARPGTQPPRRTDEAILSVCGQAFGPATARTAPAGYWATSARRGTAAVGTGWRGSCASEALRARPRRRASPTDQGVRPLHLLADNVLDRQFTATGPNQKWVADFTYLWTREGWLFVAAVLDLFSRRVVGWAMHADMTAQLVTDALTMAVWRRGPPDALLHHSDRGSQYTSESFQRLLHQLGVTCSMSRAGNVWDNAVMESFFSTLKTERTNGKQYATRNAARADVFDYIERFYNPGAPALDAGNISPLAFEREAAVA